MRNGKPVFVATFAWTLLALLTSAAAQQGNSVTFEIEYVLAQNRLDPNPRNNVNAYFRGAVTLSGRNRVSGGVVRVGQGQDVQVREGVLGGRWRVIDASTLQATRDFPQSVQIITIRANGASCTLSVEYRLKPGFTNHKFPLIGARSQFGAFDVLGVGQQRCTVRQG